jgi:hypothetical protein
MGVTVLEKYVIGFVPFPAKSTKALAGTDPAAGAIWTV